MINAILDSSIIIDLLKQEHRAIQWGAQISTRQSAITPIIWMEVVAGAQNNMERARIIRFLRQFPIEHSTAADNNWAMRQFSRFHLSHRIEMNDIIIASVAVRLAVPLYTLNMRDFAPLPDVDEQRPY